MNAELDGSLNDPSNPSHFMILSVDDGYYFWGIKAKFSCKSLQLNPSILEMSFGCESDFTWSKFSAFFI